MTQATPFGTDTRDCRLYRFYGWDPRTNYTTKTLIYIGETVREPFERLMEHIDSQPWRDTITSWEVDDRVYAGKAAVLAAEAAAIRSERPLYNVRENMDNPVRVKPWDAKAQRWARDDAAGRQRWVPPKERPGYVESPRLARQRQQQQPIVRDRESWTLKTWTAAWASAWTMTAGLGWLLLDRWDLLDGGWRPVVSALGAALLLWWSWARWSPKWKRWRRRARRWLR